MGEFYQNGVKQYTWGENDSMHPDFPRRQAMNNQSYAPAATSFSQPSPFAAPAFSSFPATSAPQYVGRVSRSTRRAVKPPTSGGRLRKTLLVLSMIGAASWWGGHHIPVQWQAALVPTSFNHPIAYPVVTPLRGRVRHHHHHHHPFARKLALTSLVGSGRFLITSTLTRGSPTIATGFQSVRKTSVAATRSA